MTTTTITPAMVDEAANPATATERINELARLDLPDIKMDDATVEDAVERARLRTMRLALLSNPQISGTTMRELVVLGFQDPSLAWRLSLPQALEAIAVNPSIEMMLLVEPKLLHDLRDFRGHGYTLWNQVAEMRLPPRMAFSHEELLAMSRFLKKAKLRVTLTPSRPRQVDVREVRTKIRTALAKAKDANGDHESFGATLLLLFADMWVWLTGVPEYRPDASDARFVPVSPELRRLALLHGAMEL